MKFLYPYTEPNDFEPGDKVWFNGLKAKVVAGFDQVREDYPMWAVPIEINGSEFVTIAHVDALKARRKHK